MKIIKALERGAGRWRTKEPTVVSLLMAIVEAMVCCKMSVASQTD